MALEKRQGRDKVARQGAQVGDQVGDREGPRALPEQGGNQGEIYRDPPRWVPPGGAMNRNRDLTPIEQIQREVEIRAREAEQRQRQEQERIERR